MEKKKFEAHCQNWCVTLFHPEADEKYIPLINELPDFLDFIEYGVEKCPTTQKLHLQCNIRCSVRSRAGTIVNKFKKLNNYKCGGDGVSPMKGTWEQASAYVKKGAGYIGLWEDDKATHPSYGKDLVYHKFGTLPKNKSGERNDLKRILKGAEQGMSVYEMIKSDFITSYQQLQIAKEFVNKYAPKAKFIERPNVEVHWGIANSGKSYAVRKENPNAFVCNLNGDKWLEGYNGESCIIFDDFRGSYLPFNTLLRIIDSYGLAAKVNFGSEQLKANKFVFTSSMHPEDWYPNLTESYDQLDGRISYIKWYNIEHPESTRHKRRPKGHVCDDRPELSRNELNLAKIANDDFVD